MPLILATCFQDGILVASGPFTFNNDGDLPQEGLRFDKSLADRRLRFVLAAIGSRGVFQQLAGWLSPDAPSEKQALESLPRQWAELNSTSKTRLGDETSALGITTLRPLSDSLLVLSRQSDLEHMLIADPGGDVSETASFVFAGSGSRLVEGSLRSWGRSFAPSNPLCKCFSLVQKCYRAASTDLYVVGFPSVVVITLDQIIDLTSHCASIWSECRSRYHSEIQRELNHAAQLD